MADLVRVRVRGRGRGRVRVRARARVRVRVSGVADRGEDLERALRLLQEVELALESSLELAEDRVVVHLEYVGESVSW